jgi:hypothetical protein
VNIRDGIDAFYEALARNGTFMGNLDRIGVLIMFRMLVYEREYWLEHFRKQVLAVVIWIGRIPYTLFSF